MKKEKKAGAVKKEVSFEKMMGADEAVSYLEELVGSFKERKIVIEQGEQVLSLSVPETVEIEVEARKKKGKEKLSIEFSWRFPEEAEPDEPLKISSTEPVVESPAGEAAAESSAD